MNNRYLEKLNSHQKNAVLDESKICIVNASVGSGKTTVLTNKVLYVLDNFEVSEENIVVLTFTNKAANEIKDRVNLLFESNKDLPYLGTFHSVALKLLKTKLCIEELGFNSDFTIITPEEESELAREIISENHLKIKNVKKLLKQFENYEISNLNNDLIKENDDTNLLINLLKERKLKNNQMSFSDLIFFATEQLKKGFYKADWIIVDEFQDCDSKQLEFIDFLANDNTHIFVVGDPNQVIYSWRGEN